MRELFLAPHDSTSTSLVFTDDDGAQFFVTVTEEIRADLNRILGSTPTAPAQDPATQNPAATESAAEPTPAASASATNSAAPASATNSAAPASAMNSVTPARHPEPAKPEVRLRPAEIQSRIRAGATAAEIAADLEVPESRIEPFAHPVLLERANVADNAKQAHPIREDGPAKLTLWEILATAFAARGHSLSEATWDAYRHQGEPWVVRVSWRAGLSENEAEWTLKKSLSSPATVEARNSVAADLVDPDFVQPVRSLTSIGRGERYDKAIAGNLPDEDVRRAGVTDITGLTGRDNLRDLADVTAPTVAASTSAHSTIDAPGSDASESDADTATDSDASCADAADQAISADEREPFGNADAAAAQTPAAEGPGDDFLQNPDPEPKPTKRRRRAVTPHWEDVLLGVRANTKRPRD